MKKNFIGIDIGGTNLRFALVNEEGAIIERSRTTSSIEQGRDPFCARLLAGVAEMTKASVVHGATVSGIGVGVPGLVGSDGLIHASVNMRPLDGFNLASFLQDETGVPSLCGNDANLIAMGEFMYGAGRGMKSLIVITIGTGLGSGLILDGRLWTGTEGFAAEFGHFTVEPEGIPCPCGNTGCLEQYVSAGAIARMAGRLLANQRSSIEDENLDAAKVARLAREGEHAALTAFQNAGAFLGNALASLTNTLNLEAAVICGGVSASFDLLEPALSREIARRAFPQIARSFRILTGTLGDDAGLLGGAALFQLQA